MAIASRFTTALPRTAAALRRRCTIDNFAAPFNLHDELHRHFVAAHAAQALHPLQTLHAAHAAHAGHDLHQQPAASIAATAHAISSNSSSSSSINSVTNVNATTTATNTAASTNQRQHSINQHQLQQQQHSPIQLTPAFIQSCLSPPPPSPQTPLSAHAQNVPPASTSTSTSASALSTLSSLSTPLTTSATCLAPSLASARRIRQRCNTFVAPMSSMSRRTTVFATSTSAAAAASLAASAASARLEQALQSALSAATATAAATAHSNPQSTQHQMQQQYHMQHQTQRQRQLQHLVLESHSVLEAERRLRDVARRLDCGVLSLGVADWAALARSVEAAWADPELWSLFPAQRTTPHVPEPPKTSARSPASLSSPMPARATGVPRDVAERLLSSLGQMVSSSSSSSSSNNSAASARAAAPPPSPPRTRSSSSSLSSSSLSSSSLSSSSLPLPSPARSLAQPLKELFKAAIAASGYGSCVVLIRELNDLANSPAGCILLPLISEAAAALTAEGHRVVVAGAVPPLNSTGVFARDTAPFRAGAHDAAAADAVVVDLAPCTGTLAAVAVDRQRWILERNAKCMLHLAAEMGIELSQPPTSSGGSGNDSGSGSVSSSGSGSDVECSSPPSWYPDWRQLADRLESISSAPVCATTATLKSALTSALAPAPASSSSSASASASASTSASTSASSSLRSFTSEVWPLKRVRRLLVCAAGMAARRQPHPRTACTARAIAVDDADVAAAVAFIAARDHTQGPHFWTRPESSVCARATPAAAQPPRRLVH